MMLLIGLAITVAFLASWGASLGMLDHELDFWWELALLIVIMLLGHWIEMRSLAQTTSALDSLAALLPDEAERVEGDSVVTCRTGRPRGRRRRRRAARRPGARPTGGSSTGAADMDESMITGESPPRAPRRRATPSSPAPSPPTPGCGSRSPRSATTPRSPASSGSSPTRRTRRRGRSASPTRAAGWLFWFALGAAALTAVVWTLLGMPDDAVIRTITVLVIACPHALGLAIPLVVSIATERAARGGVLVKDRLALESMRTVDAVLFDKTGTLTTGEPAVIAVEPAAGRTDATRCSRSPPRPRPTASIRSRGRSCAPRRLDLYLPGAPASVVAGGRRDGDGRRAGGSRSAGRSLLSEHGCRRTAGGRGVAPRGRDHPARARDGAVVGALQPRRRDPPRVA